MKKNTKGAIALGAAALLLAGGAGTYATWSDDASLGGGTVQTGHLTITEVAGESGWTWATPGKTGAFDPLTDVIVPGDSVKFQGKYTLGIEGTNITASVVATDPTTGTLPTGLTWAGDESSALTGLTEANDGDVVTAGGTLTFDSNATGAMDQDIAITGLSVTLKQTAPAVAP